MIDIPGARRPRQRRQTKTSIQESHVDVVEKIVNAQAWRNLINAHDGPFGIKNGVASETDLPASLT